MSFSIHWNDVPEAADSDDNMARLRLIPDESRRLCASDGITHTFIEGDNYPALRLLLAERAEAVDVIYIDPPYNTRKTHFTYNDSFSDDEWLSFMRRRLECATRLLKQSGCIFIAIGTERVHMLKLLCDSIFGAENFINDFMWLHGKGKKDSFSRTMQQSTLCYAKNKRALHPFCDFEYTDWAKTNADGDVRGAWFSGSISFSEERSNPAHPNYYQITSPSGKVWKRQWLISRAQMDALIAEGKIYWGQAPQYDNVPRRKIFNGEKSPIIPKNMIDDADSTRAAQGYVDALLGERGAFDNPKPVNLIAHLLRITAMPNDSTVLDFFAGSGTTLEAVTALNAEDGGKRRCILIQKAETITRKESVFKTIADLCYERIKRVLAQTRNGLDYYSLSEK